QYTSAATGNHLATRAHPASVYSSPTRANAEHHASMCPAEARHVLSLGGGRGRLLALEPDTAAQAPDLRLDRTTAARARARRGDPHALLRKMHGVAEGDPRHPAFLAEVEALRQELAGAEAFHPGARVAAAHAAIRERIAFLDRDRALDGDVAAAVKLVAD